MRIIRISAHQVDLPLKEGRYSWSNDNAVEVFDSTVVALETDAGITGYGECCPLGPAYLPAYARGVRAGLAEIAPALLGVDPTRLGVLDRRMDKALRGHPYVKSAIDVACWDILGQVAGLPVHQLLGGAQQDEIRLYRAISQDAPDAMAGKVSGYRAEGYRKFQLKVGGEPDTDIERIRACRAVLEPGDVLVADANTGWTMHEAARVVAAVRDLDVYIEQPCPSYEECLTVRRRTALPFVLDEVIDGLDALLRGLRDGAMDVVNLKISKLGGLTRAREMRDLCVRTGVAMTIEDSWGGDIVNRDDRPTRDLDPGRVPVLLDRLQFLRHPRHRQRRTQAGRRHAGCVRAAWAWDRAVARGAGRAGALDRLSATRRTTMQLQRAITVVGAHAEGEAGRVITTRRTPGHTAIRSATRGIERWIEGREARTARGTP